MIPAEIKEVIERGKKACVYRSGGLSPFIVTPSDLLDAAIQIKKESVMLTVVPKDERPDIIQAAEVLGRHLGQHEPDTGIYMDLKAHDVSLNGAGGVNQAIEDDQDALDEAALALDAGF